MNMLFKISCTTCQAKFAVHDPALIGQIIACPKCGSMILVEPLPEKTDQENLEKKNSIPPIISETPLPNSSPNRTKSKGVSENIDSSVSSDKNFSSQNDNSNIINEASVSVDISSDSLPSMESSPVIQKNDVSKAKNAPPVEPRSFNRSDLPQKNLESNIDFPKPDNIEPPINQNIAPLVPPVLDSAEVDSQDHSLSPPFYLNRLFLIFVGIILALVSLILIQLLNSDKSPQETDSPIAAVESEVNISETESSKTESSENESLETEPSEMAPKDSEPLQTKNSDLNSLSPQELEVETDNVSENDISSEESVETNNQTNLDNQETVSSSSDELSSENLENNEVEPLDSSNLEATAENETTADQTDNNSADDSNLSNSENNETKPANDENGESDESEELLDMTASTTETSFENSLSLKVRPQIQNIQEQLSIPVKSIVFPQNSLPDIISVLSGVMNVPISVDLSCFELIRQSVVTPVEYRAENKNIGDILKEIADLLKLIVQNDENQFILTAPELERTTVLETTFDVHDIISAVSDSKVLSQNPEAQKESEDSGTSKNSDLNNSELTPSDSADEPATPENLEIQNADSLDSEKSPSETTENNSSLANPSPVYQLSSKISIEELRKMIELLIDPESWESNGGTATIKIDDSLTSLTVRQTEQNRRAVEKLLEQVRGIRQLPEQADLSRESLIPELLGWEKLSERISLNYVQPVPLADILAVIANSQKIKILIDQIEFSKMGVRLDQLTTIRLDQGTIDQILNEILRPLHLSYIILAENLILISSAEKTENYKTIEIHLFSRPDQPEKQPLDINELCDLIASWDTSTQTSETANNIYHSEESASKQSLTKGTIWIDETSGCLVVRQSQPVQRLLRLWLENRFREEDSQTAKP